MKTIEELAREWADQARPTELYTQEQILMCKVAYMDGVKETLTSLLEELPQPDRTNNSQHIYQTAYYHKIKSLIEKKLK